MSSRARLPFRVTGSGAIAASLTPGHVPNGCRVWQVGVVFKSGGTPTAPTTPEDFTFTINAVTGAAYDRIVWLFDPGTLGVADVERVGENETFIVPKGDTLDIAYTNTDTRDIAVELTFEPL